MDENLITLTIDGQKVKAKEGTTILQAAKQAGIDIAVVGNAIIKSDNFKNTIETGVSIRL